jgi:hypothetical protein
VPEIAMKPSICVFTAALLAASVFAHADAGGTVYHHAAATKLVSGYAYSVPDAFDPKKQAIVVVLSDTQIDAAAFDAAEDRKEAIDRFLLWQPDGKATTVTVMIGADKSAPVEQLGLAILAGEGLHSSASVGSGTYALDLTRNDGKHIKGSFRTRDVAEKSSPNGDYYDLHFALDVASGPAFGPGLPPDGGEPFAAYKAYINALRDAKWKLDKDSYQGLINTLSEARGKAMNQISKNARAQKASVAVIEGRIKEELARMSRNVPAACEFVRGHVNGDVATIEIDGKRTDDVGSEIADSRMPVVATMKKEEGSWYFDKDQVHAPAAAPKK